MMDGYILCKEYVMAVVQHNDDNDIHSFVWHAGYLFIHYKL